MSYHRRFLTPRQRFESLVEPCPMTGCWIWLGAIDRRSATHLPYGKFWVNGGFVPAHRAAWELLVGEVAGGRMVLHRCDLASCVNPAHLFLGSAKDNTADMIHKERHLKMLAARRGERSNFSKLCAADVEAIRSDTRTQYAIAAAYGVSQSAISLIKNRKNWGWL